MLSLSIVFLIYFVAYLMLKSKFSSRRRHIAGEEEKDRRSDKDKDVADANNNNDKTADKSADKTEDKTADAKEAASTNPPVSAGRKVKPLVGSGGVTAKLKISKSCSSLSGATWPPEREHPGYTSRFVPNDRTRHAMTGNLTTTINFNSGVEPGANGDLRRPKHLNQYSTTLLGSMVNLNAAAAAAADEDSSYVEETWIDLSKIGNIFSHEGSSLYLRFATLRN